MAARAGLDAIANAGLDKNDIDLIIVATATPDRKAPSTACIAQAKMGITSQCPAFDIAAVCSGFLYGMTTGAQFIQSGVYERVLVIGVDTFSKITDWKHRNCVFFGDGAGAVVLERRTSGSALFSSVLFADSAGMNHFTVYPQDATFTMNARAVYDTATSVLPAKPDANAASGQRLRARHFPRGYQRGRNQKRSRANLGGHARAGECGRHI
jgi:3-oxoacyl-[acyl-carrier-protein] synthase-3